MNSVQKYNLLFYIFRVLEIALRLWQRTKQGYEELKETGFIKLPSGRHLRYIKKQSQAKARTPQRDAWLDAEGCKLKKGV